MIKNYTFALAAIVSVMTLTGCASTGRVHDKNYLRALSINSSGESTEKTLTFSFFTKEGETMTVSGENIDDIQETAEIQSGREIFMGYTELIILDDRDCCETLEFLLNDRKISPSCIVAYGNSDDILSENSPEILCGSIKTAIKQGKSPKCDIITVLSELLGNEKTAEIAEISTDGFCGVHKIIVS